MIDCIENEDGTFTISWDENDPLESVLNDWTEEDFIQVITDYAEQILAQKDYAKKNQLNFNYRKIQESNYQGYNQTESNFFGYENPKESREESRKTSVTEATEKDWEDFWEDYQNNCSEIKNPWQDPSERLWEG